MQAHLNSIIDSLALDHLRGAAEIVDSIIDLFVEISREGLKSSSSADQLFRRAVRNLVRSQPTMAPVLNILNRICLTSERVGADWEKLEIEFTSLRDVYTGQIDRMKKRVNELPKSSGTLMTFSNSSTVARLIIACREYGWPEKVVCGEGRPLEEGLVLAKKLTAADVPVTVYTDAASMSQIVEADSVWIGGDALSRKGLVNKAGSLAFAMLAKVMEVPFISLMASDKLLSEELFPFFSFLPQNPREIAADEADELNVINEYYENIPLELITHVFTEEGLFTPNALLEKTVHDPISDLFYQLTKNS